MPQSHVGGWSATVKIVAVHEFKVTVDVRIERGQMATGQKARTGRPVPFGTAAVRGGVSAVSESVCASIAVTQKRDQTKRWLHEFR